LTPSGSGVRRTEDARGDPEGPLGAHEDADEVVARRVGRRVAQHRDGAVGQDDLQRQDVVGGDAVLERVGAAGVLGDVAADGARVLARGVGRVVKPVGRDGLRKMHVDDARLHPGLAVEHVDLQDLVERAVEITRLPTATTPPERPGARASGNEGHVELIAELDDAGDLGRRLGKVTQSGTALSKVWASHS
jgi:hypothetical protein